MISSDDTGLDYVRKYKEDNPAEAENCYLYRGVCRHPGGRADAPDSPTATKQRAYILGYGSCCVTFMLWRQVERFVCLRLISA